MLWQIGRKDFITEALRQAKEKAAQKSKQDWEQGKEFLREGYRKTDAVIVEWKGFSLEDILLPSQVKLARIKKSRECASLKFNELGIIMGREILKYRNKFY